MLNLIKGIHLRQTILTGAMAKKTICGARSFLKEVAFNHNYCCALVFYNRINFSGMNETGIYFGPGPECDEPEKFEQELWHMFSINRNCFLVGAMHYDWLVRKNCFLSNDLSELII